MEVEERLAGHECVDHGYLKGRVVRAVTDVHHMVDSLEAISGGRYPGLAPMLDRIAEDLTGVLEDPGYKTPADLVLDLGSVSSADAAVVGGKMASLGETGRLGLPVPDGFAATVAGFRLLVEENGLGAAIQGKAMAAGDWEETRTLAAAIRGRLLSARVPADLEAGILSAYDRLCARTGRTPRVAVRSSAPGEDGELSFAGQFESILNVSREGLCRAWLEVVASLYSPEAVHYRKLHRVPPETACMAVGFVEMIDAGASGMVYSNDPSDPDPGRVLIQAVRGLAVTLADGQASPEAVFLDRGNDPRVLGRAASGQSHRVVCGHDAGVEKIALTADEASRSSLRDEDAVLLARWALVLERHFGGPQDVEWARAMGGNLLLLQSRPLRMAASGTGQMPPVEGRTILVEAGETACPGAGSGIAVHMDEDGDLDSFPEGAVLVAPRSSPRFVRLMSMARAIVTDTGGTPGHIASLSGELPVPTLVGTRDATRRIPAGTVVTVDATGRRVYEGAVDLPGATAVPGEGRAAGRARCRQTRMDRFAGEVVRRIAPLNLTDPRSSAFSIESCVTLHDLARFMHEKSYEEMFRMGEDLGDLRSSSKYLDVFLPMDLYIIDLGGGLEAPSGSRKVKRSHVTSVPLRALLSGILDERIPRYGPRPMDVGGFFSIMARHALTSPEEQRTFRDPCYALVSDRYLNYTARVGYHFGVVDSYCGKTVNKNYVSILFRGGAANIDRRTRRASAIAGILREHGFRVIQVRDRVTARVAKTTLEETVRLLSMVGRMLQFMRQMDVAMVSDATVDLVRDSFLREDYSLKGGSGKGG